MDVNGKIYKDFLSRIERFKVQNGPDKNKKQHLKGKLHARERIALLFDKNSFEELDAFVTSATPDTGFGKIDEAFGDGVVIGHGRVNGRLVYVYSQDFTVMGGSLGAVHARKIMKVQELALRVGAPIIGLIDSGGARIQEGVASLAGYTSIFHNNIRSSGVIPQISVILGPAAGGAVYSPALTDFVFMTKKTSYMFLTGPDVVKEVLNEVVTFDELGGAETHARKSGVANFIYEDEENTILGVKKLLSFFPSNNLENPPYIEPSSKKEKDVDKLRLIVPDDPNKPYDVKKVIELIIDQDSFFEASELFAPNIVTGFARLNGKAIGIVANQPKILAGVIDINSSNKAARFVRFCDAFNIPLLVLEDVPGFLPGLNQEHNGIIKHGAKLLFAFSEATVPKITVILRKAYGGAFCVMNSKNIGGDYNFAWPTAEIAVMGPEGAVSILYRKEIQSTEDPKKLKMEFAAKYRHEVANPYIADEKGYIDEVIDPADTRKKLIIAFETLENKHVDQPERKHGNIPL
ncbi:MAG TPA: methylmalonyl-CoA carboxyltransferase [Bacteroidales bacterium]|nr:methylmalonyl-CoA carboxyltransferase [Bacteroidales bacterium]